DYAGKQDSKTTKPEKKPQRGATTKPTPTASPAPETTASAAETRSTRLLPVTAACSERENTGSMTAPQPRTHSTKKP
ncbi:hypothetical protein L914_21645, partial [Phytophthora nicotianae]